MVGPPYDCVMNPLGAVRSTFKQAYPPDTDQRDVADQDWGVRDLFNNFLFHQNGLSQVPILDRDTKELIQSNTLVRFRGMIQDMLVKETYIGAYKDGSGWRTNRFTDLAEVPLECGMKMLKWERLMYRCVPVPGLNLWTESSTLDMVKRLREASRQREKRKAVDHMDLGVSGNQLEGSPMAKKMREGRHSSESTQPQGSNAASSVLPDIPEDSLSCIVKIYDAPESDFKLNEVYEFIGIFTSDPENQHIYDAFENYFANEAQELHLPRVPPRIKVPHLQCIIHRKLGHDDFLLKPSMFELEPDIIKEIREDLLRHLTEVLGGDRLAAEFMLLHLLSKVHHRADPYAVGKFSLNLYGFNKESAFIFRTLLRIAINNLLPFSTYLPVTFESLNAASFSPIKDENTNRLITGPLQVVDGTHLILDTTEIEPGVLNSVGSANVKSLKNVCELQKVYYAFEFYHLEFLTDIQLLVLSKGKSKLCPADLVLPFQPLRQGSAEESPEYLDPYRWYLAKLRSRPFTIEPQLQRVIEKDLATVRRVQWNMGEEDFSRLLTMGRLICTSYGETSLSWDHWNMVIQLESQRRQRLNL